VQIVVPIFACVTIGLIAPGVIDAIGRIRPLAAKLKLLVDDNNAIETRAKKILFNIYSKPSILAFEALNSSSFISPFPNKSANFSS
jgi:hypothetical protein